METNNIILLITGLTVGVLHTAVPDHWLPIAIIARARRWSLQKTAFITGVAGLGHVLLTGILGLVVYLVGIQMIPFLEQIEELVVGGVFIFFGLVYLVLAWRDRKPHQGHHQHHADPHALTNKSDLAVGIIVGLSPCVTILPVFLATASYGYGILTAVMTAFVLSTIATMILLTVMTAAGIRKLSLPWLETYPNLVTAVVFLLAGLFSLVVL